MLYLVIPPRLCPNCGMLEKQPYKIYCSKCEHKIPDSVQEMLQKTEKAHYAQ
ncbi:hypothetical protein MOB80_13080 [Bacillus inaquosorum]|uniref:hypothetical protein n=1 Tax=Bacillus inaquosorum TaxID=483913 RepID=UPI002281B2BF|nr:hypothetical protein [Bacillus inaquosorum]MCY8284937.1 hypothetical protein [Bacillus inaquosorum]MCY9380477.1 hypothetical protein [Bacillus inaquosorum]